MDLKKELFVDRVQQDELEMVLLNYFGRGEGVGGEQYQFRYRKEDGDVGVTLTYDNKGLMKKITSDEGFTPQHLTEVQTKITDELLENQILSVGREVCFSVNASMKGCFAYKDLFQILPVPADAPDVPYVVGEHPFLMEYRYTSSTNLMVNNSRKSKQSRELISLLHLLSKRAITSAHRYTESAWVLNTDDANKWSSEYKQVGYFYDSANANPSAFTPLTGIAPIQFGENRSHELSLLENTEQLLDRVFSLDDKIRMRFITACYWLYTASEVWKTTHSGSYVCLITSIECLMTGVEKCEECNTSLLTEEQEACAACHEPMYRIGKTFKEFLETNANDIFSQLSHKEKSEIYGIRSNMVHGLKVFERDFEHLGFIGYSKSYEDSFQRAVSKLVFTALHNWLLAQ